MSNWNEWVITKRFFCTDKLQGFFLRHFLISTIKFMVQFTTALLSIQFWVIRCLTPYHYTALFMRTWEEIQGRSKALIDWWWNCKLIKASHMTINPRFWTVEFRSPGKEPRLIFKIPESWPRSLFPFPLPYG